VREDRLAGARARRPARSIRLVPVLLALLALPAAAQPAGPRPGLSQAGTRAYDLARSADDEADLAHQEGEATMGRLRARAEAAPGATPEGVKATLAAAEAGFRALAGYRRQTQVSATETLTVLAEVARLAAAPKPDPIRREVLEQRALLSAHEAAVMAARTRIEAERLRAVLAEARAGGEGWGAAPAGRDASASARTAAGAEGGIAVPNLVGARLEAATRDLAAAGLRLGATEGPRDGFVVKQSPEAGTQVAREAAVTLILSGSAATVTDRP
jgi:hypothetical protein